MAKTDLKKAEVQEARGGFGDVQAPGRFDRGRSAGSFDVTVERVRGRLKKGGPGSGSESEPGDFSPPAGD